MHRSKIEWCDDTWNPITGCMFECKYCYARKRSKRFSGDIRRNMAMPQYMKNKESFILDEPFMAETGGMLNYPFGFKPTYHKYRLNYPTKRKHGCNILVGEMGEIFGDWIPDEWIKEIMDSCLRHPEHNYLFMTKNPERYWDLEDKKILPVGDNMWYGFSYPSNDSQGWTSKFNNKNNFVCLEPLQEDLMLFNESCLSAAKWVIIGAETGVNKEKVIPKKEWIDKILRHCDKYKIPVFMKDSLIPIVGKDNLRREFPEALLRKETSKKVRDRLEGDCCKCKTRMLKSQMIALSARSKRGEMPKQISHICYECFISLCKEMDIEIPKLEELKYEEKEL